MKITLVCHKYSVPLADPCCYPLGFMYVSARLKAIGHEVKILNYNLFDYDLRKEIEGQDLVGFTGFEEFYSKIIEDAKLCRELGIKTIVGGALATFCPDLMSPHIDTVISGEFDKTTPIDKISLPDYDGFGIEEYYKRNPVRHIGVLTSRGCPYRCSFCSQTCSFRLRSLIGVFEEVDQYISKYKPQLIVFNDNTLNTSESRFLSICNEMKSRKLPWGASIRCDVFTEVMAKAAQESACQYFVVGVESFSQQRLDKMRKHVTVEQIVNTLELLHKYSIDYHGNILLGFEDETYQDIANELALIPAGYKVFPMLVQPFIGTDNGKTRLISEQEELFLTDTFKDYVTEHGKYQYPELPKLEA